MPKEKYLIRMNRVRNLAKQRQVKYVIHNFAQFLNDNEKRKIICIDNEKQFYDEAIKVLKEDFEQFKNNTKLSVYHTSKLNPLQEKEIIMNDKNFIIIFEDERKFSGECERLHLDL